MKMQNNKQTLNLGKFVWGGANRLAILAVAVALACSQPVLATLYVATNGGGKLSAASQSSYESLRQRAVSNGGVVVTVRDIT